MHRFTLIATLLVATSAVDAMAGLLTTASFERQVFAYSLYEPFVSRADDEVFQGDFNGDFVASKTLAHVSLQEGTFLASYDFRNDAKGARFNYATSFSMPGGDGFAELGVSIDNNDQSHSDIVFTVDSPVAYAFASNADAVAVGGQPALSYIVKLARYNGPVAFVMNGEDLFSASGILTPGTYLLTVLTGISGYVPLQGGPPLLVEGSTSFEFGLVPIPEPSGMVLAGMALVGFAGVALRRRRLR